MKLDDLLLITQNAKTGFLEGSRQNEINYTKFHFQRFKDIFLSYVGKSEGIKILDIGTSPFTIYLKNHTNNDIYTIDYSDTLKERCLQENIFFAKHDLQKKADLPFEENYFDLILFTEVFEHLLSDPVLLIKRISRCLKKGGVLIIGTPNLAIFKNRLSLLLNRRILEYPSWEIDEESIHGHGHNRLYVSSEIVEYCRSAGMNPVAVKYRSYDISGNWLVKIVKRTIDNTLFRVLPSLKSTIYVQCVK